MYSKSHYFVLAEDTLKEMLGPSMKEQWLYWSRQTSAQQRRHSVIKELDKLLNSNEVSSMFVMCQIYFFVCACVCVCVCPIINYGSTLLISFGICCVTC